jgi:hypothetical protein
MQIKETVVTKKKYKVYIEADSDSLIVSIDETHSTLDNPIYIYRNSKDGTELFRANPDDVKFFVSEELLKSQKNESKTR